MRAVEKGPWAAGCQLTCPTGTPLLATRTYIYTKITYFILTVMLWMGVLFFCHTAVYCCECAKRCVRGSCTQTFHRMIK